MESEILAALISAVATLIAALLAGSLTWYATRQQHREARGAELRAQRREVVEQFLRRLGGAKEAVRALIEVREVRAEEGDEFDHAKWLVGELGGETASVRVHLPPDVSKTVTTVVDELRDAVKSVRQEEVQRAREAYQRAEAAEEELGTGLTFLADS